ncbi:metal ABC transporter solute-binding protein, Zn/Mn family [Sulfurovum sp. ST-21]|uniref:Zinc ABC transporter substrate-binding protein n=1 Tax=Sulfurovum indicum TaxID=2779528 RepID=A0A7M1S634_9BACT|nr:zinc ABC transporter substrate-binding protein [Sulfurovum indicum]QOR62796.1 zinc ABC transporter substrate-binding protein [Sulfurovum indicum]
MKKILFTITLLNTLILANINAIVSILPEKTFVKAIGGEKVTVTVMVLPGNSPHTYEPKPAQMQKISRADLYFAIGVEFEKVWLSKFQSLNPKMEVIDLSEGIKKLPMVSAHHHDNDHHEHEKELDPHIWTAPEHVVQIAQKICDTLARKDPLNKAYYKTNLNAFLNSIRRTDKEIRNILSPLPKGTRFMVFHPSWGYFAKAYGLVQMPVELEGKNPKPKELITILKEAREENITAIFTQPEFSDSSARVIADELEIPVIKVSPLAADWSANLLRIAKAIAGVR